MNPRNTGARAMRRLCAAALMMPALAVQPSHGQAGPDPVSELIRKAEAKEPDNGFCARITDWPAGTRETYIYFLGVAVLGFGKVNRFQNNTHCQFDRVTEIYSGPSGKCVRYTWWACATDKGCASGSDADCRMPHGDWKRQ
ncbi:MAG TPA: hypothetical protein VIF14_11555 [Alphaproteobacteria bacterium]|jgi:hypothetical protein